MTTVVTFAVAGGKIPVFLFLCSTWTQTTASDTKRIFNQVDDTLSPSCLSPDCSKTPLTSDPFRQHDHRHTEVDVIQQSANENVNKIETEGSGMLFDRPTLMSDYELPGPTNLRCVYRGERNVSCSWKLATEVAQYISYTLSYRTHSSSLGEWCCVDNVEVTNARGLLRMVGVFSIFEPGVQEVQLTPTPATRVIHAYKHIQPACPTALCVELSRQEWILNWTLPKYRTIRLTSQLEYWSTLTPKDVKTISLSDPVWVFSLPERSLIGSSEYRARVRCSLSMPRRPGQRYAGYPSEWTDPVSWTTHPEPLVPRLVAFFLYFLIATLSAAISVVVFFLLVVTQRRLRDWNASIPSPVHSKVSKLPQRDFLTSCRELKDPDISSVQIVGVCPQSSSFDSESAKIEQNQVILHIDDPCVVPTPRTFGGLMRMDLTLCDSAFQPHTFRLSDAVLPCSEGYMQNPATYTDTTQNALQVCHRDTEMNCTVSCPRTGKHWTTQNITSMRSKAHRTTSLTTGYAIVTPTQCHKSPATPTSACFLTLLAMYLLCLRNIYQSICLPAVPYLLHHLIWLCVHVHLRCYDDRAQPLRPVTVALTNHSCNVTTTRYADRVAQCQNTDIRTR
ncbi:hypothetical protein E1301_Tti020937 [Triplophysa tibetana]|uniref:Fibronectin type-III domain-containing protein n=1 Tax=Triplophysa tibetana TaxID=1572043 RepID=A0A5A9NSE5_9TELE|nr:hypothetical protein E1301_Tti020937 [Triplophysa tibetana]